MLMLSASTLASAAYLAVYLIYCVKKRRVRAAFGAGLLLLLPLALFAAFVSILF